MTPGECLDCGEPLTGKQEQWCSDACRGRGNGKRLALRTFATDPETARLATVEHCECCAVGQREARRAAQATRLGVPWPGADEKGPGAGPGLSHNRPQGGGRNEQEPE